MHKRTLLAALGMALAAGVVPAHAQLAGKHPIKMILPTAAGTAPDVMARLLADQITRKYGRQVIVENKPGAGGILAVNAAKAGAADGSTLLFAQAAVVVVTPHTFKEAKYDMERDFETVGVFASTPMLFVANPEKGPKSWADAVGQAKASPEKLSLGSPNRTSIPHLTGELVGQMVGARFNNIPMSTTSQGLQAVISGDTVMYVDGIAAVLPMVKANRVRALAVSSLKPLPGLEGIPLAKDAVPNLDVSGWFMVFAPKGTPKAVVEDLNATMNAALADPAVVARMRDLGNYPVGGNLADASAFLKREKATWADVLKRGGFHAE